MTDSRIIVEPYGGLGNRIRAICSSLWVRDLIKAPTLDIVWHENSELNIPFSNLFELPEQCRLIPFPGVTRSSFQTVAWRRWLAYFFNGRTLPCYQVFKDKDLKSHWKDPVAFEQIFEEENSYYFHTCEPFGNYRPYFSFLRPIQEIQEEVESIISSLEDEGYFGVHIRRTDHVQAISKSSSLSFEERMEEILMEDPNRKFFVTSDDPTEESYFLKRFAGAVIVRKKEWSRVNHEGAKDALIDMLILARATKILGSFNSSFSQIASDWGGVKLEVIQ